MIDYGWLLFLKSRDKRIVIVIKKTHNGKGIRNKLVMDKGYPFKRYLDKYMMSIRYNVK